MKLTVVLFSIFVTLVSPLTNNLKLSPYKNFS